MHCELILPGLFAEASGSRAPSLELLLARGRASSAQSQSVESWLREEFGLESATLPAGALTLAAAGAEPGEVLWARADPVHLRLMRDRLIVVPSAAFGLSADEAHVLVEALNRHFGERLALKAVGADRWCVRLERATALESPPPIEMAGRDADQNIPSGWRALLNEAQMLLHAHPLNEAREARGEPTVNSLWLWGAGRLPRPRHSRWQSVSADDPVVRGLAQVSGARQWPLCSDADAWLARSPTEGRHLVLLDELRAPLALGNMADYAQRIEALEKRWFAPLLAALRAGRIGMVTVDVPDGLGASFETIRGDLRRFWRRPKALEKYA
jgi:hypothetical protein